MTHNPYAPTASRLEELSAEIEESAPAFYVVSPHKFAMLYLLTAGIYLLYWFYKNWRIYSDVTGERVSPVLRAIFAIFFVHSLFDRVKGRLLWAGIRTGWSPGFHATFLLLLFLADAILSAIASRGVGAPILDLLSLLMIFPLYAVITRAQHYINLACGDPDGTQNDRLTFANYAWMLFGLLLWLLSVIGFLSLVFGVRPD